VDGGGIEAMLDTVSSRVPNTTEWLVIHVVDTRGRIDLGMLRSGVAGAGPLTAQHRADIESAADDRAREVLSAAGAALQARAFACAGTFQRRGEPGREICTFAAAQRVDLVVVHARRRPGATVGPPSVGPTARFFVDHAPWPVLVLRGLTSRLAT
jgi:nucleotide-binding universal stress UspA family protein